MAGYRKWWEDLGKVAKIVLSIFGIFGFLYRLFGVIIEKAESTERLVYTILNVIPIIGTVIVILDIVWVALDRPFPTCFADWGISSAEEKPAEENVVEAEAVDKEDAPKEEEPKEEAAEEKAE